MQHNFWLAKPYGLATKFSQSEVVLHSYLQFLQKKTNNVLQNFLVTTDPALCHLVLKSFPNDKF